MCEELVHCINLAVLIHFTAPDIFCLNLGY